MGKRIYLINGTFGILAGVILILYFLLTTFSYSSISFLVGSIISIAFGVYELRKYKTLGQISAETTSLLKPSRKWDRIFTVIFVIGLIALGVNIFFDRGIIPMTPQMCLQLYPDSILKQTECLSRSSNIKASNIPSGSDASVFVLTKNDVESAGFTVLEDKTEKARELMNGTNSAVCSFVTKDGWIGCRIFSYSTEALAEGDFQDSKKSYETAEYINVNKTILYEPKIGDESFIVKYVDKIDSSVSYAAKFKIKSFFIDIEIGGNNTSLDDVVKLSGIIEGKIK
jgi:hypothetical protein